MSNVSCTQIEVAILMPSPTNPRYLFTIPEENESNANNNEWVTTRRISRFSIHSRTSKRSRSSRNGTQLKTHREPTAKEGWDDDEDDEWDECDEEGEDEKFSLLEYDKPLEYVIGVYRPPSGVCGS